MPRYVILKHETSAGAHYDFMLEMAGWLKTWSLPKAPEPDLELDAKLLVDHRLAYLDYEGPISGNRGSVVRWDQGTYELFDKSEKEITVHINGEKLVGKATLRQISAAENLWQFCSGVRL